MGRTCDTDTWHLSGRKVMSRRPKLSLEQVVRIRQLFHEDGWTRKELSYEYRVSYVLICKIISGELRNI